MLMGIRLSRLANEFLSCTIGALRKRRGRRSVALCALGEAHALSRR